MYRVTSTMDLTVDSRLVGDTWSTTTTEAVATHLTFVLITIHRSLYGRLSGPCNGLAYPSVTTGMVVIVVSKHVHCGQARNAVTARRKVKTRAIDYSLTVLFSHTRNEHGFVTRDSQIRLYSIMKHDTRDRNESIRPSRMDHDVS